MQMHSMVKEYFTDAQTYMLSQQLLSTLAAATIEWSNKELKQHVHDGVSLVETSGPIYGDPTKAAEGQAKNEQRAFEDQAKGGTLTGDDLGLNIAQRDDITKNVLEHTKIENREDAFITLQKAVGETPSPAGNNADEAFLHAMRNSALNVTGILESDVAQKMTRAADKQKDQWEAYGGYLSVLDCGTDPFCLDPQIVTPGNILSKNLSDAIGVGTEGLKVADELGETTGTSSQELTYQLQQRSLRDYEVQQLLTNQQTPQELFDEFEQVLIGYYGLGTSTTYWSRNMLVNTWDDLMWGGGAPWKAGELGERLKEIKDTVDTP